MSELQPDLVMVVALLVQDCRSHATELVAGHAARPNLLRLIERIKLSSNPNRTLKDARVETLAVYL